MLQIIVKQIVCCEVKKEKKRKQKIEEKTSNIFHIKYNQSYRVATTANMNSLWMTFHDKLVGSFSIGTFFT